MYLQVGAYRRRGRGFARESRGKRSPIGRLPIKIGKVAQTCPSLRDDATSLTIRRRPSRLASSWNDVDPRLEFDACNSCRFSARIALRPLLARISRFQERIGTMCDEFISPCAFRSTDDIRRNCARLRVIGRIYVRTKPRVQTPASNPRAVSTWGRKLS